MNYAYMVAHDDKIILIFQQEALIFFQRWITYISIACVLSLWSLYADSELINCLVYSIKIKIRMVLLSSEFLLAGKEMEKDACLHYEDRCYGSPCSTCMEASTISIPCTRMFLNLVKNLIVAVKRLRKKHFRKERL